MTVKGVLNLWDGWDSTDTFEVHEMSPDGRRVACHEMTGLELVEGRFAERSLKRFGSCGNDVDGTWQHYVWVPAE